MKIVINTCYGGFGLSQEVYARLGIEWDGFGYTNLPRNDPALIEVVESIGTPAAAGAYSRLKIVEIPDDVEWEIDEYDGAETVHETHRVWS